MTTIRDCYFLPRWPRADAAALWPAHRRTQTRKSFALHEQLCGRAVVDYNPDKSTNLGRSGVAILPLQRGQLVMVTAVSLDGMVLHGYVHEHGDMCSQLSSN